MFFGLVKTWLTLLIMDYNLLIGIVGLVITIVGLFFGSKILKSRITGNENNVLQQQGEKNIIIGMQINHGLNRPTMKARNLFIVSGSQDHLRKYHQCSHCKFGFKYFQTTDQLTHTAFQQVPTVQCPNCESEDAL